LSTTSRHSIILSTADHHRLLNHLQAWCRQDRGRQSLLATKLGVSRQSISAWLNGSRMMSLDQYFEVLSAIEQSTDTQFLKDNPMNRPPVFNAPVNHPPAFDSAHPGLRKAATDDDEPIVLGSDGQPKTLASAKELLLKAHGDIAGLQNEVTRLRAAAPTPRAITSLPPPPPPPSATVPPATVPPATATTPATVGAARAKATLASASTADLLNALILARKEGNIKVADQIQAEVRARAETGSSSRQPPAKPTLTLPATATTPAAIRTVFDNSSMTDLRAMLQTEKDSRRRMTIFREIKRREKEG
jgi:transcriptional regulator with XRE-family HTH domain